MTAIPDTPLADLVATLPAAARVLDGVGLDYCCHGDQTLRAACAGAGLDVDELTALLTTAAADAVADDVAITWTELGLRDLVDHVATTHHDYLHAELPLLEELAAKVHAVHGDHHPELAEVHRLVSAVRADLEPHLMKEERILFPAIRALADGQREFPFGPIANPIQMMRSEHDVTGELLRGLRRATDEYAVPDDACNSYRSLYERLEALEHDTHVHIHKENHTLFPAAIARYEGAVAAG